MLRTSFLRLPRPTRNLKKKKDLRRTLRLETLEQRSLLSVVPTVFVNDAGGTYNGSPFSATATVAGLDGSPVATLEGVSPTCEYYSGSGTGGTDLGSTAPTAAGTYTVVASFAGSTDYASAQSSAATFTISQATPLVQVTDAGGTYNGSAFPASAQVTGVNGTAVPTLEGVSPTYEYYVGTGTGGTDLGSSAQPLPALTRRWRDSLAARTTHRPGATR